MTFRRAVSLYVIDPKRVKNLWNELGISPKLRLSSSSGFLAAPEKIDCSNGCDFKIVGGDHLDLLPEGHDEIARVCTNSTCRFLVLHQQAGAWSLIDYLDSPFEKYEPPTIAVEAAEDRRWLVKRGFGGGGTGVYVSVADWFELHCGALEQVLSLPAVGHDVNARPARYFTTRFKGFHKLGTRESLEFAYIVLFQDSQEERQLWQEERTVVFSRADSGGQFVFDPSASDITAAFRDKVFAFDSMNENDFVEFAYDRLLQIAENRADRRRAWLHDFLGAVRGSSKVSKPRAALQGQSRGLQDPKP